MKNKKGNWAIAAIIIVIILVIAAFFLMSMYLGSQTHPFWEI